MKVEKQVCSLELAKRLSKLRVKQESAFWYEQIKIAGKNQWRQEWTLAFNGFSKPYDAKHIVSAFTVAELGEMLPIQIDAKPKHRQISSELLAIQKGHFTESVQWQVMYYDVHFENADTEADARAKMLIYLLEHNLV